MLFSIILMLSGNMILYQIYFWMISFYGKKFYGLEINNPFLFSAYFTLITLLVAYAGATLINWGLLRESLTHRENTWLPPLLLGITNIVALSIITYLKRGELGLDFRTSTALALMVIAQIVMRLPK